MKTHLVPSVLAIVLLAAPASREAAATTGIMKCATADGSSVYTDHACRPGSRAVPISGELLTRIARDEARHPGDDAPLADAVPLTGRRSVAGGCARTPTQLAMDLRASLALGDVNRVAESYHWAGMSTREGERVLDRLQHLVGRPVADIHYFDATISGATQFASASGAFPAGSAGMLQLQVGQGEALSVVDFDVERYSGCYFVKF